MTESTSFEKLKTKLAELFQLDQADLDFGIYRIMNARRDEITRFLNEDLLPQVREAFSQYRSSDREEIQAELDKVIEGVTEAGMDPDESPRVKELRTRLAEEAVDITALENEVYDHLYSFFSRYYDEGDFISQRRYKEGVYAIPYEGEEVKLHWANHDQYYIKTTENFREYAFNTPDDHRVHFKIVEADTEKDNVKAQDDNDRRFLLHGDKRVTEENGELVIRFEYRPDTEKRKQDDINEDTVRRVIEDLNEDALAAWQHRLSTKWTRADGSESKRTILEKHLSDYTRRNTFDYFIHKDLGGFLRRELDFYIKNEVMRLDDVEEESAPRVEQYLSEVKVIRKIAHRVIDFLEQIEGFQKRLWLKKKFVIETDYCVLLGQIPEELYPEIAANDAQREEWVELHGIDTIEGDLATPGYSTPLSEEFLKAYPTLLVDTCHFAPPFKDRLRAALWELDKNTGGLLVSSENFQALHLVSKRLSGNVKCIYIDPPYNATATQILYKNEFKHSSWLALMRDRLVLSRELMSSDGILCVTIDDYEKHRLRALTEQCFSEENHLATVLIRNNPSGRATVRGFAINHEYAHFVAKSADQARVGRLPHTDEQKARYDESDDDGKRYEWENFRKNSTGSYRADRPKQYYPIYHKPEDGSLRIPPLEWQDSSRSWQVEENPGPDEVAIWPKDKTGSERVWRFGLDRAQDEIDDLLVRELGETLEVYKKKYLRTEGSLPRTWWDDPAYSARDNGTRVLRQLFGGEKVFEFPKSVEAVKDCIRVGGEGPDTTTLDYFAGSGTTAQAIIELNREDDEGRRFVLVEMGEHFDTALLRRVKKVVFAPEWKDGKPGRLPTEEETERSPRVIKYIRLESYEDALANIQLTRSENQQLLLDKSDGFRESYMLGYMLDAESDGSPSLLNIDWFDDPWNYKLLVGTGSAGETKPVNVDLVETFNWLLGLRVRHIDRIGGFQVVEGTNPKDEKVLVIWRKIRDLSETDEDKIAGAREQANRDLEEFFKKQQYNTLDSEYDIIYVNGDNNLMNIPLEPATEGIEPRYKVRLIEEEFKRLMFDVQDV